VTDNSNNPLGASVIYEKWSTPKNLPPNTGSEVFKDTGCFSVVSAGNPQYIPDYNWEILVSTSEVGYNGEYQSVFFSADGYHEVMTWLKFDSSTDTPSGKFIKTVLFPVQAGDQITLFFDKDGFDFSDNLYRYWDSGADLNYTAAFGIPYRLEAITGTIKDEGAITLDQVTDFDHTGIIDNSTEPVAGHSYTFLSLEGVPTAIEVQEIGNDYVKFIYKYDYLSTATTGGNITGIIDYSGSQTGDLYIMVGHGTPDTWDPDTNPPVFSTQVISGTYSFSYSYNTGNIPAADDYTIVAWIDSDTTTVGVDGSTTTVDLTLQDPGAPSPPPSEEFSLKINSVSPSKISPDNDGVDDFFTLDFDILAGTSSAESASVRIVADTNGNGKADAFDWSKIVWDDSRDRYINQL